MEKKEKILKPVGKTVGGAMLPHLKATAEIETVIMPPPAVVSIPMQQNIGAPAKPVVKKGDKVFVGTVIGEAGGFVSAAVQVFRELLKKLKILMAAANVWLLSRMVLWKKIPI